MHPLTLGGFSTAKSKEAETKDLWLEDQDIALIDLLLQWVYGGGGVREPGDEDRCDDV
jgi:hypothetical protein